MKTTCEFHFGFWDVTARADAHFEVSQNQEYARIEDINREERITSPNVATLEPNFGWPLDGSKELLPADPRGDTWGWWSTELSRADLTFTNPPTLTVTFMDEKGAPTPHSSAGITLTFVATLPKVVNIKWYGHRSELLADQSFIPTSFDYFCDCQVENYYKVVIAIPSMARPHRFLRVSGILFGVLEILDSTRLVKAKLTEEINPAALTLPINMAELSFFTPYGRFALLDPDGAYKLFQWKQELTGYKVIDGERTMLGKFYLQHAAGAVDAVTSISCVDIVGILDTLDYVGGIYNGVSLEKLLAEILAPEDIPFEIDPSFAGVTLTGYLPICKKRIALQQISFAIGAVVDTTRVEGIRFYPLPEIVTKVITPARKIVGHKIKLEELVTQVEVTAHQYTLKGELKELNKTTLELGEHTIKFPTPVSVASVTGATLVVKHPNYCTIKVQTAGEVVISGYNYIDTQTVYTVTADPLPAGAKPSSKSVSKATLVDSAKAPVAAQRLYDFYQLRYTDEGQLLPGQERPAERTSVDSLGGKTITGYIQRVLTDLTGGCLETITVRGR